MFNLVLTTVLAFQVSFAYSDEDCSSLHLESKNYHAACEQNVGWIQVYIVDKKNTCMFEVSLSNEYSNYQMYSCRAEKILLDTVLGKL